MSEPYLCEIRIFSFLFAPRGWSFCNGQTLAIAQNQAVFSILGTTYGGNGVNTFQLPNLQGRVPAHVGNGIALGQSAGEATHTLILPEVPQHNHIAVGSSASTTNQSAGNLSGPVPGASAYAAGSNTTMNPAAVSTTGGSQPHDNMSPYLALTVCIALQGIFPSRN